MSVEGSRMLKAVPFGSGTVFFPSALCAWGLQLPLPHASLATSMQHVTELLKLLEQALIEFQCREPLRPFPFEATVCAISGVEEQNQGLQVQVTQVQIAAVGLRPSGEQPFSQRRLLGMEHGSHAFEDR